MFVIQKKNSEKRRFLFVLQKYKLYNLSYGDESQLQAQIIIWRNQSVLTEAVTLQVEFEQSTSNKNNFFALTGFPNLLCAGTVGRRDPVEMLKKNFIWEMYDLITSDSLNSFF